MEKVIGILQKSLDKDVLVLGSGPGILNHRPMIEAYIEKNKPFVIALNSSKSISEKFINARAACHPVRVLADCTDYLNLPQPLITPASNMPSNIKKLFENQKLYDFGINVSVDEFIFNDNFCTLPNLLVLSYVLAIASSGKANKILLAGFDGYGLDDPRRKEVDEVFHIYEKTKGSLPFFSITETHYEIPVKSIYGLK